MSLAAGDLTTPSRFSVWSGLDVSNPKTLATVQQLISSMSQMLYSKLNRSRIYSQSFVRTFDGVGTAQLVLPDYPVTSVVALQQGQRLIPPSPVLLEGVSWPVGASQGYGYRFIPWGGNLPGENAVLELVNGFFYVGPQNIKITYIAGYLISNEPWTVPSLMPYTILVNQPQGIWSRDNGVVYASSLAPLVPVSSNPMVGQYIPPSDVTPGLYTFSSADALENVLISYSFIPADLEEACNQMVAERYSYRNRIGEISKSLGGQESVRFLLGNSGQPWNRTSSLPPAVMDLINPYINVVYPSIGAPL